jgi:Skp family chaperone for outer membrane proteins
VRSLIHHCHSEEANIAVYQLAQKTWPTKNLFSLPCPFICRILYSFLAVLVLFSHLTVKAEENQQGLISPEQMAESLDNALANHRTELEGLKGRSRDLENLRDKIQAEIKTFSSQNTAHSQILLTSQLANRKSGKCDQKQSVCVQDSEWIC